MQETTLVSRLLRASCVTADSSDSRTTSTPCTSIAAPYRLTKEQFESAPVSEIQRERRQAIRDFERAVVRADFAGTGYQKVFAHDAAAQPRLLWTPGILMRTIFLPAGLKVTGKRHAQEHGNIVSCGRATVYTEEGVQEVVGPCEFVSPAGTKRLLVIHEDMVWTTVHRTNATTIEEAEAELIIPEPLELT